MNKSGVVNKPYKSTYPHVSTVNFWWQHGYFPNTVEAIGAFKLAHEQGKDGLGRSVSEWMGLTEEEFADWMRNNKLPERK